MSNNNFVSVEVKTIGANLKAATDSVKTSRNALKKAQVELFSTIESNLASAIFHASNAAGAAGNLGALIKIVDAIQETEYPTETFKAVKTVVFKSAHGIKLSEDGKGFSFKDTGKAAKAKRNLIEGFHELKLSDYFSPPAKSDAPKGTGPATGYTEKALAQMDKKFKATDPEVQSKMLLQLVAHMLHNDEFVNELQAMLPKEFKSESRTRKSRTTGQSEPELTELEQSVADAETAVS